MGTNVMKYNDNSKQVDISYLNENMNDKLAVLGILK